MPHDIEFFDVVGPALARTACLAVTSTTSNSDITADSFVGKAATDGQFLRMYADGADVYYGFAVDASYGALDETATGATAGKCACIPAGTFVDISLPWLNGQPLKYLYLKTKTGLTATMRISPSSIDSKNRYMQ